VLNFSHFCQVFFVMLLAENYQNRPVFQGQVIHEIKVVQFFETQCGSRIVWCNDVLFVIANPAV